MDQRSLIVLLVSGGAGIAAAGLIRQLHWTPITARSDLRLLIALGGMAGGTVLRWIAVFKLGRLFTVHVSIAPDQRLVRTGVYRFVRHPSYGGLLVAVAGIAFAFNDWLTFIAMLAPLAVAVIHRLRIEERVLQQAFPREWDGYCLTTWRLVPWLY